MKLILLLIWFFLPGVIVSCAHTPVAQSSKALVDERPKTYEAAVGSVCRAIPDDWKDIPADANLLHISSASDLKRDDLVGPIKTVTEEVADLAGSTTERGRRIFRTIEYDRLGNRIKLLSNGHRRTSSNPSEPLNPEAMISMFYAPFDKWTYSGDIFGGKSHVEMYSYDANSTLAEWRGFNEAGQLLYKARPEIVRSPLLESVGMKMDNVGVRVNFEDTRNPGILNQQGQLFATLERNRDDGKVAERFYYYLASEVSQYQMLYDIFGNLSTVVICVGGNLKTRLMHSYDAQGNWTGYSLFDNKGNFSWGGSFVYNEYDRQGNWTKRTYFHIPQRNALVPSFVTHRTITYY